jgi:outer membrane autotransporter protein
VTTAFNTAIVINVGQALSGSVIRAIIITEPVNGTATVNGTVITYTPKAGFFGTDTLAFAGLGLGGVSPTQILTITVAPPGPPTVASREVSVPFNTPVPIDLSGAVSGVFTSLSITTQPAHGTVTLNGNIATYRPANNYTGPDSFAFAATGPGGTSTPATVSLTVNTAPPIAAATTMAVALNGSGTIDLAAFISGSGITGVKISTPPAHGSAGVSGTKVTYTPNRDFFGTDTFRYIAFGNAGDSPPATVTVTIVGRPDPTKNPVVTGLIDAQGTTAMRMGRAQISNFQQRLQSLHGREPGPESASQQSAAAAPAAPLPGTALANRPEPVRVAAAGGSGITGAIPSATTDALSSALANSLMSLAASQSLNVAAAAGNGMSVGGWSVWAAGTIGFGNLDVNGPIRFRSDGVSAGVDRRVNSRTVLGFGIGYARDEATLGPDGSKNNTDGASFAAYGSFQPSRNTFVDVLAGYASLDMDSDRFVPMMSEFARASRRGEQWFGSVAAGYEYRIDSLLLSPYGRLDYARTRLKEAAETGGGAGALVYHPESITLFQGVVGLRAESQHETRFGSVTPRARLEYSHEFEGDRTATISYADQFGTQYTVTPFGTRRNAMLLGIGSDFNLGGGMKLGLDYQTRRASRSDVDQMFRIQFTQDLDRMGPTWFAPSTPFENPVRFDATFTYDDNVNRARDDRDILADRIFNFGAAHSRIYRLGTNSRVVGSLFVNGDEFYRYTGLSRFSGGASAEFQYRTSGDFDATTFGLQVRGTGDYYDSVIRRGYKVGVQLSARQSLTDRIDAFAALIGNKRWGRSAVFDTEDYGAKVNLDYALGGVNGAVYLSGEYRRGDVVSSGRFALESIDVADVFTADDAFPPGYFAYRFDAKTWIGTLGYNRPLGPRDAVDFSWRRAQSTPTSKPSFNVQGPFRYDVNQYSITYLMRF